MLFAEGRVALFPPLEDAAMLFKYAANLAAGHGIVWNPGESPGVSDGATDLGFVLAIAPLVKLGLAPEVAAAVLSWVGVYLLGVLVWVANAKLWRLPPLAPLLITVLLASGPLNHYIAAGFSPVLLGVILLAVAVTTATAATSDHAPWVWFVSGSLAGLAGWWRPEGFAFSLLTGVVSVMMMTGPQRRVPWRDLWRWAAAFLVLAGSWVAFRVLYFGQLLPTSAVMKGGSGLSWGSVVSAIQL